MLVALRKESVDRNNLHCVEEVSGDTSLSARRAWIEILIMCFVLLAIAQSLSARRAWIEIVRFSASLILPLVALRKESVDRNPPVDTSSVKESGRSPQGERG